MAVRCASTSAPVGRNRPTAASTGGVNDQATAPPDAGLPIKTSTAHVGSNAHRPTTELNIVKIIPAVIMPSVVVSQDWTKGRSSAPTHQSATAVAANPPSSAYAATQATSC